MGGVIRCARRGCEQAMEQPVCSCGNVTCYVAVYWQGRKWRYRRDKSGDVLTYGKAVKLLNSIREQIDSGTFDPRDRLDSTVNERRFENKWGLFMQEKQERVERGEISPSYARILNSYRRKWFAPLETMDVRDVRLESLAAINRAMSGQKIKTRQNVLNTLKAFMTWCLEQDGSVEKLPRFPSIDGDDATPRQAIDRRTQDEALARIPEHLRDPIELGMETGCRPGEVAAFKVRDVQGTSILVCRTYSDYTIRETTKQKRKQLIPLSDRAYEIVARNCQGKHPEAWLFINPRSGGGYRPKVLGEIWRQYSGLEVSLYEATRHSFCTQLVLDGCPLPVVRDLARHSDIRTTQKYVHPTDDSARRAINTRGKVVAIPSRPKADRG